MSIWSLVTELQGRTLKTLDQGKPFDIVSVTERDVLVKPHISDKERPIKRSAIEGAYNEMIRRGELDRAEVREKYSDYNPAYVVAILATFPNVIVKTKPIRLEYKIPHKV